MKSWLSVVNTILLILNFKKLFVHFVPVVQEDSNILKYVLFGHRMNELWVLLITSSKVWTNFFKKRDLELLYIRYLAGLIFSPLTVLGQSRFLGDYIEAH
jgi:hypothetical protein